ncbi:MAG: dethiobiotin synthase [Helicobacteraceae bacterium]|nr:dethiobiotin synthase [Helicobacteraceae bacterium]
MNGRVVFISATGTGVGKTYAACALIACYAKLGLKVAPFKPIETGVIDLPSDAKALQETARAFAVEFDLETICPVRFRLPAAPAVARGDKPIDWDAIDAAFERLRKASDLVMIEGAGGALAPIDDRLFSVDLAKRYDAKTLLIAPDRLGMIHDLLTTLEAVEKRLDILPLWAINARDLAEFELIAAPYLTRRFAKVYRLDRDVTALADLLIA